MLHLHPPVQNWANEIEYQVLNYNYNELFQKIPIHHGGKKRGSSGRLSNFEIQYSGKEVMKLTVETNHNAIPIYKKRISHICKIWQICILLFVNI